MTSCPQCGMTDATQCRRLDCNLQWGGEYPCLRSISTGGVEVIRVNCETIRDGQWRVAVERVTEGQSVLLYEIHVGMGAPVYDVTSAIAFAMDNMRRIAGGMLLDRPDDLSSRQDQKHNPRAENQQPNRS